MVTLDVCVRPCGRVRRLTLLLGQVPSPHSRTVQGARAVGLVWGHVLRAAGLGPTGEEVTFKLCFSVGNRLGCHPLMGGFKQV